MRFLFINPNRQIAKGNVWGMINSLTPPLGLAVLAAVLEAEGHAADIVDAGAENLNVEAILAAVPAAADVIGITATTPEINSAIELARSLRQRFPAKKIVMGGVHPTIFHATLVAEGVCDMVVRGEGERAVLRLAEQTPLADIPNLTWKSAAGAVIVNREDEGFVSLDELPMPAYHKLPMRKYRSAIGAARRSPSIGMITSRGCPGACTFCYSGMFGNNIRYLSAGKVFAQILALQRAYGIREISFYDDTFTANRQRVEELCRLIIDGNVDISWSCFARVDTVNPGILKLMKAAGCHQIMYGFETIDENVLRAVNKRVKVERYADVVSWTRTAGIDIRGAFMLGSPGETEATLRATIDYAKKVDIQYAIINITTPFPGTALFAWAEKEGRLGHTRWVEYDLAHAIMTLPALSPETVERHYRKAYQAFYLRWSYVAARLLSIRTADDLGMYREAAKGMFLNVLKRAHWPRCCLR